MGCYRIDEKGSDVQEKIAEELKQAAMPLLEFLNKHYCPYAYAIVTEGSVMVVETDMVMPLPVRD